MMKRCAIDMSVFIGKRYMLMYMDEMLRRRQVQFAQTPICI